MKKGLKKTFYYLVTGLITLVFLTPLWMVFINAFKEF